MTARQFCENQPIIATWVSSMQTYIDIRHIEYGVEDVIYSGGGLMLFMLCIIVFPFVFLSELMKLSK